MKFMNLSKCPLRVKARIVEMNVEPQYRLRLQELGVRDGAEFTAVNRAAFGGVVVNIGGTRVAVDRNSARRMEIEVAQ